MQVSRIIEIETPSPYRYQVYTRYQMQLQTYILEGQ